MLCKTMSFHIRICAKPQNPKMDSTREVPWEDLPEDLLSAIVKLLTPNSIDMLSFRSVCKSWYSSSPRIHPYTISVKLPITVPYPEYHKISVGLRTLFGITMISATAIFAVRKGTQCWLMLADQLTPGKIMLRQHLTKSYYSLPVNFPKYLDVPNVRVDEISRFYNLNFHDALNKPPTTWSKCVCKVVLNSDESVAFVLFRYGKLSVLNLNLNIIISEYANYSHYIEDVVNYKGKILGVDYEGKVYEVGLTSLSLVGTALNTKIIIRFSTMLKRLVESNGFLYLVVRSCEFESNGEEMFKIFVLDQDFDDWVEVTSVDGRIFFFGRDFSFSVSPQELGGSFGKDCIVYYEGSFGEYYGPGGECVDYDGEGDELRDGDLRIGVWHMEDPCRCGVIGSYPGCSNILWPPPTWL